MELVPVVRRCSALANLFIEVGLAGAVHRLTVETLTLNCSAGLSCHAGNRTTGRRVSDMHKMSMQTDSVDSIQ